MQKSAMLVGLKDEGTLFELIAFFSLSAIRRCS
jgi:hypothetical protein